MNIIIYITSFIIGSMLGSFFTLVVYRLPLKQNITYKRSYCPICNHALEFLDLIPIISFIALKGKCRYCGEKIKIRYLIFEILSGTVFLLLTMSFKLNIYTLKIDNLILLSIMYLIVIGLIIVAGISKESNKLQESLIVYELLINIAYMVYLCIFKPNSIYIYAIYVIITLIILLIAVIALLVHIKPKNAENNRYIKTIFYISVLSIIILIVLNFIYLKWG